MDQTEFAGYRELLDCLEQPAFLVQSNEIVLRNRHAALAEQDLVTLLSSGHLQSPAVAACGSWNYTLRPFRDTVLVLASQPPRLNSALAAALSLRKSLGDLFGITASLLPYLEEHGSTRANQWAAELNRSIYRLLRMTSNLDTLSSEHLNPHKTRVELTGFLQDLEKAVSYFCTQAGVRLTAELPERFLWVMADRQLLERALLNLVANAIRFSGPNSSITLRLSRCQDQAVIEVLNTGEESASLEGVLDRYESGPTDPKHGLGLGLPLVRRIAQLHDGVFLFHALDCGASATLALPVSTSPTLTFCSPTVAYDYTGGFNHYLVELADVLPSNAFHAMATE